jgi:hypothetical protein
MKILRYLWVAPITVPALFIAGIVQLVGGEGVVHTGVVEVHGPLARWFFRLIKKGGMTLGHVVFALDQRTLDWSRNHERVHVKQYERWGIVFVPAYILSSLVAWVEGKHYYYDNAFEREAFDKE